MRAQRRGTGDRCERVVSGGGKGRGRAGPVPVPYGRPATPYAPARAGHTGPRRRCAARVRARPEREAGRSSVRIASSAREQPSQSQYQPVQYQYAVRRPVTLLPESTRRVCDECRRRAAHDTPDCHRQQAERVARAPSAQRQRASHSGQHSTQVCCGVGACLCG
jgi:hypothetical protein